jgi:phosphohistidine phosphatase
MARELLIFRHGKSDWSTGAQRDFDRPLAKRGRKAVKRMARWMRAQGLMPDFILSSTAERARQTTLRCCRHGQVPESIVCWEKKIYEADLAMLLRILESCGLKGRGMLVGHNPGLEELVAYLSGSPIAASGDSPPLPTAALARLSLPDDWTRLQRGCARLIGVTRPRELPV